MVFDSQESLHMQVLIRILSITNGMEFTVGFPAGLHVYVCMGSTRFPMSALSHMPTCMSACARAKAQAEVTPIRSTTQLRIEGTALALWLDTRSPKQLRFHSLITNDGPSGG